MSTVVVPSVFPKFIVAEAAPPILNVVAAPPKFIVVAVALRRLTVEFVVVIAEPVIISAQFKVSTLVASSYDRYVVPRKVFVAVS